MTEGIFPKVDGDVLYASEANGLVPIGTILPWVKSLTNTPALTGQFVECNGQTLSDADSVYNGIVIPNLNGGTYRMLRGSSTSGTTAGSDTHSHGGATGSASGNVGDGNHASNGVATHTHTISTVSNLPAYYEVVWIIRVK